MTSHLTSLATRLGIKAGELDALAGLPEEDLVALDSRVAQALAADDQAVSDGIDATLRLVPRPLRGRAAKALGV